jgi:hypothetical protein
VLSAYLAAALANIGRDAASLVAAPAALAYKEKRHQAELQSWPTEADSRFSDLFRGEEVGDRDHLDLGKVQMFLFTVVLVLAYGLAVADMFDRTTGTFAALPAIDDGVVTLLAISHAGYLTRKALPVSAPAPKRDDA